MATISREEVLKIATISNIRLLEEEIEPLQRELQAVLSYAERVTTVKGDAQDTQLAPINVLRADKATSVNPKPLLDGAPNATNNYFIVPLIIDQE